MERLTPERFREMMRKKGIDMNLTEATIILAFLRKLADIAVRQYLKR